MRLRQLPLPVSSGVSAVLVITASLLLLSFPRRAASGLDRLIPLAALLQSFRAEPGEPPPALWQQRLGPVDAQRLWLGQHRLWWQMWGAHGEAGAHLILAAPSSMPLPAQAVRVDDLAVIAPDPLARQLLLEQLKARRRAPRGLARHCSANLQQQPTVLWAAAAMGTLLGPLTPLAQELEQGCLVLSGSGRTLSWQGEADASEAWVDQAPPPLPLPVTPPLGGDQLLELRGDRLEFLLRGPLESALLRQVLAQTYGLGPAQISRWQDLPFVLRLRSLPTGPFQAGLELELQPRGSSSRRPDTALQSWLKELSGVLQNQGLSLLTPQAGLSTWSREDGSLVGGWRWLADGRLLLFLGPVPTQIPAQPSMGAASWRLRLQPQAMARAGLLPEALPQVVRRAQQLVLQGRPLGRRSGERVSALSGALTLP